MSNDLGWIKRDRASLAELIETANRRLAQSVAQFNDDFHGKIAGAYLAGVSITELCEAWGTTDRKTISSILKARGVYINRGCPGTNHFRANK